jgi:3-oxoacyl-[acyl-carrier-protein] synthase-3
MTATIKSVAYSLPERVLGNQELETLFPEWTAENIEKKIGIAQRHVVSEGECASDLAVAAAQKLFGKADLAPADVDYILLCTQSPDYLLPTTACLIQHRLGIPITSGALDINLGCSGYVYGLGLAKGLIETGQARNVLLLTAETYSRYLEGSDKNVRTVFGDGAAATWVAGDEGTPAELGPFVYGTDGAGAKHLMIEAGGARMPAGQGDAFLRMNGPAIFAFTLRAVPDAVERLLKVAELEIGEIDLFVFHQANQFMLETLREKLHIPKEKFLYAMRGYGNTVSSSIPIALAEGQTQGLLKPGMRVMLVGFGVGLSWGACLVRW